MCVCMCMCVCMHACMCVCVCVCVCRSVLVECMGDIIAHDGELGDRRERERGRRGVQ